jgi:hypothetical protein
MKTRTDNPFARPMTRLDYRHQRLNFGSHIKHGASAVYACFVAYSYKRRDRFVYRHIWNKAAINQYGTPGQVAHRKRKIKRPKMEPVR